MLELTDEILASWVRPAVVNLDPEDIVRFRAAVSKVAGAVDQTTAFHLVGISHGLGSEDDRAWLVDRIRETDPDFVDVGRDALIARLACCSVLAVLEDPNEPGTLTCLLAQSALFLGKEPAEPELTGHVEASQRERAAARRARPEWTAIAAAVAEVLEAGPISVEEDEEQETVEDVHGRAIQKVAAAIDTLAEQVGQRGDMTDEEYNALWWSYTRRSETTQTPWSDVSPLPKRIVLVADELGAQVTLVPSPPMVRGLLALALEGEADEKVALKDVMLAAAEIQVAVATHRPSKLLPISSAVARIDELGVKGTTWSAALAKTLDLKVSTKHTALESAMQLVREVEIGVLL